MESIQFKDKVIQIQRKAFRRSMSIHLSLDGILIKTSLLCRESLIREFLLSKETWIEKNMAKMDQLKSQKKEIAFNLGEKYPFLGEELSFRSVITLNKEDFFSIHEDHLLWHSRNPTELDPAAMKPKLQQVYKRYAISELKRRMQFWTEQMNLHPKKIKFNEPTGRWGSCSSQGNINLNWKMIVHSPKAVDYILIHELAHLKHLNHSKDFWNLVSKYCPDHKVHQKELKKNFLKSSFLDV